MKIKIFILSLLICAFMPTSIAQVVSDEVIGSAIAKADELMKAEKFEDALVELEKVREFTRLTKSSAEIEYYYSSQLKLCECWYNLDQPEKCYLLAKEVLNDSIPASIRSDVEFYFVLGGYRYSLTLADVSNREFAKARELLYEVRPYANVEVADKIAKKIADYWYMEAICDKLDSVHYENAYICANEARNGYSQIDRKDDMIQSILLMGDIKYEIREFEVAIDHYQDAKNLARMSLNDSKYMKCLKSLSVAYAEMGNMEAVHHVETELDSLMEHTSSPEIAFDYYISQGDEAKRSGQFDLAEQYYLKAGDKILEIGTITSQRTIFHTNMMGLYHAEKRYDEAIEYAKKVVNEIESSQLHLRYYAYFILVECYKSKGDSINAFESCDSLLKILNAINVPQVIYPIYVSRGRLFLQYNNRELALVDFRHADSILVAAFGENEGERIYTLPFLANAESQLGFHLESENHYRKYVELIRQLYGESHTLYVDALYYLANVEAYAGHIEAGCADYVNAIEVMKQMARAQIPYLSNIEKESFWSSFAEWLGNITPFAIEVGMLQTEFTRSCYDVLLLSKAFLLESERSIGDIITHKGNDKDKSDYDLFVSLQSHIKTLAKDYNTNADSIMVLTKKMSSIDRRLKERCRDLGEIMDFMDIDYTSVKEELLANEVLIDFTDYMHKKDGRKYAAYIIEGDQRNPILVPLFSEKSIDSMQFTRPDQYYDMDYSAELVDYIWTPLTKYINEGETVYYVPSTLLFQIALESLPMKDGSLLGEHYHFVRLSSARELKGTKEHSILDSHHLDAVLYGGLQYSLEPSIMARESQKYNLPPSLAMRSGSPSLGYAFRDLPGTKTEVEKIGKILKRSHVSTTLLMGKKGSEESFVSLNGNAPAILHLATHGFYVDSEDADDYGYLKGYKDAMMLSGLIMSGGNAAWSGKELGQGVMGGILTAENIARMDLTGVDLVVLSACQTGQGKPTPEGLFGLQRAFKKAGARTIVMSLWDLDDAVALEFMELFYDNLTSNPDKWDKRKAFEKTKMEIRDRYMYKPSLWAPFIMLD